jgi:phage terminase large subunit GpA-like protein
MEAPKSRDPYFNLEAAEDARQIDIRRQERLELHRRDKLREIAELRWKIATTAHKTERGEFLDFDRWPFLEEIYKDDAMESVLYGAAGWGKSELLICDAAAKATLGLRVFYVLNSMHSRNKMVLGRIDPGFASVPFYKGMLEAAKNRGAEVDSANFKHFGDGSINFINSNSDSDFFQHRADCVSVDEHQLCNRDNLRKTFHRMTGSDYGFVVNAGNPDIVGTAENQNIDWEYQQSDQRQWHIPCPSCGAFQVLGWWSHLIEEKKNEYGAILEVKVRDPRWDPEGEREPWPVCTNCAEPMPRLSHDGAWRATAPGRRRRGRQLSSLYNPTSNMTKLFGFYRDGLHDPSAMKDFVNNQLGLAYNTSGSSITEDMLEAASTGSAAGVAPYRMVPAGELEWAQLED